MKWKKTGLGHFTENRLIEKHLTESHFTEMVIWQKDVWPKVHLTENRMLYFMQNKTQTGLVVIISSTPPDAMGKKNF
jgi:hypothetical protein